VFTVVRRKTFTILAILLVCTIAAALLECQVHAASSQEYEHAAPIGHHHRSSLGTTGHGACLIAVLPTVMFLMWFAFVWLHVSLWFVRLTSPAFPPFIPPKTAVC
jgi:hypothetical protein